MSKNHDRYKDDYRVEVENLDELDDLEVVKFEKFSPHKKKTDSRQSNDRKPTQTKEREN